MEIPNFGRVQIPEDYWANIHFHLEHSGKSTCLFSRPTEAYYHHWPTGLVYSITNNGGEFNVSVVNLGMESIPYVRDKAPVEPLTVVANILEVVKDYKPTGGTNGKVNH